MFAHFSNFQLSFCSLLLDKLGWLKNSLITIHPFIFLLVDKWNIQLIRGLQACESYEYKPFDIPLGPLCQELDLTGLLSRVPEVYSINPISYSWDYCTISLEIISFYSKSGLS